MAVSAVDQDRPTRFGLVTGLTFVAALVLALAARGNAVIGIAALFLLFVPLEKLFALRPQKVFRRGLLTDLTHLLVNTTSSRRRWASRSSWPRSPPSSGCAT
jgi:hypothetical protein